MILKTIGAIRFTGEIGHFTIIMDGEQCACGNRGCFERYASYNGLKNLMDKNLINLKTIEELFESKDEKCKKVIEEYCKILGIRVFVSL
ncbi:ROK family protein [uncultured Brachyspira sp.]|uniref:ROK family protein n=1 Tax=uncultured Brachyspira sp. TaxID=221953 RepID=UPI002589061E|nr:ROK family protein [uncultured Brachyspira sp.]